MKNWSGRTPYTHNTHRIARLIRVVAFQQLKKTISTNGKSSNKTFSPIHQRLDVCCASVCVWCVYQIPAQSIARSKPNRPKGIPRHAQYTSWLSWAELVYFSFWNFYYFLCVVYLHIIHCSLVCCAWRDVVGVERWSHASQVNAWWTDERVAMVLLGLDAITWMEPCVFEPKKII